MPPFNTLDRSEGKRGWGSSSLILGRAFLNGLPKPSGDTADKVADCDDMVEEIFGNIDAEEVDEYGGEACL